MFYPLRNYRGAWRRNYNGQRHGRQTRCQTKTQKLLDWARMPGAMAWPAPGKKALGARRAGADEHPLAAELASRTMGAVIRLRLVRPSCSAPQCSTPLFMHASKSKPC